MRLLCIYSLVFIHIMATPVNADDIIIVVDCRNASLWTGPVDTLELVKIPLEDLSKPIAVDYEPVEQKVYWTDSGRNAISKAFLNGTEQEIVVPSVSVPEGISLDSENQHIYWTDRWTNTIERSNLDGSEWEVVLEVDLDEPGAIVVDSVAEHIYWTDWGVDPKIERASLEGNDRVTLVSSALHYPNGLVIDFTERRLYWCDAGLDRIETTNLNGFDRRLLYQIDDPDSHPFDIGIYMTDIYWSDRSSTQLFKMDKNAELRAEAVGPAVFANAKGLHIHQDHDGSCFSHRCQIGGRCRQLIQGYQCVCLPGYVGELCESVEPCSLNPCSNGQCLATGDLTFFCNCQSGWQGDRCNLDINECAHSLSVCHADAICTNSDGSYACECRPEYIGDGIQCIALTTPERPAPCDSQPCLNGGVCSYIKDILECQCQIGFTGQRCDTGSTQIPPVTTTTVPPTNPYGCQHPGNLENGYVIPDQQDGGKYPAGETVEYLCMDGYVIESRNDVYCKSDFTWSHDIPKCVTDVTTVTVPLTDPYGCQHPGNLENGYVIPDQPNGGKYPAGDTVEYLCMYGYVIEGRNDVYCKSDFTWSHNRPKCVTDVPTLVIGTGVAVGVVSVILIAALIFLCCRKSPPPTTEGSPSHNTQIPNEDRLYDGVHETVSADNEYADHISLPDIITHPQPSSATTNPTYAEVEGERPLVQTYISFNANNEDPENGYMYMGRLGPR